MRTAAIQHQMAFIGALRSPTDGAAAGTAARTESHQCRDFWVAAYACARGKERFVWHVRAGVGPRARKVSRGLPPGTGMAVSTVEKAAISGGISLSPTGAHLVRGTDTVYGYVPATSSRTGKTPISTRGRGGEQDECRAPLARARSASRARLSPSPSGAPPLDE